MSYTKYHSIKSVETNNYKNDINWADNCFKYNSQLLTYLSAIAEKQKHISKQFFIDGALISGAYYDDNFLNGTCISECSCTTNVNNRFEEGNYRSIAEDSILNLIKKRKPSETLKILSL